MQRYEGLYQQLLKASVSDTLDEEIKKIRQDKAADEKSLDSLLNPQNYPVVIHSEKACTCDPAKPCPCALGCLFSAIERDEDGKIHIAPDCTGCMACIRNCEQGAFVERKDAIPLMQRLREREVPVYAMIAPAFLGQFGEGITSGKLRAAFKQLGFYGMLEVALFADILTLKEALEYDRHVKTDQDFLLTSCCCPLWLNFIRKFYTILIPHIPPSVSPMVACGRAIKTIHPEAVTVFVGPCLAKKAEAKEKDVADAVDFVLTFTEMRDIFDAVGIHPNAMADDVRDHSSTTGRIYARTGGVSASVQRTLDRLVGKRSIPFIARQTDGAATFKSFLAEVVKGNIQANFLEGMGCVGGCVGGPRTLIGPEEGTINVNAYGDQSAFETPVDNPYIFMLLKQLGFETVEDLIKQDHMFVRKWDR